MTGLNSNVFEARMGDGDVRKGFVKVKVVPRSSRDGVAGRDEQGYRIKLTAAPVDGKANKALISLLARRLGVAKGDIEILSGMRSKRKLLRINGLSEKAIAEMLDG